VELSSLLGVVVSIFALILGILLAIEMDMTMLVYYLDGPSVVIVFVGSIGSALWATPMNRVVAAFKALPKTFKTPDLDAKSAIDNIISLSNLARRESLLALEEPVKTMNDPFLLKGVMLVVDGADPELVRNVLETEIAYIDKRHSEIRGFYDYWGGCAPSWGMFGTLIGLINMLANLNDPGSLGSNMATCIVTTFYGSIVSTVLCGPTSSKLKIFSNDELLVKEVLIEGILSIQAGDNPRIIEEKLKSFLSPALRASKEESGGGE